MHGLEMTGCVIFECHMQAHISGWVDSRLKYLLCISNGVAAVAVIVCTLYDSSWESRCQQRGLHSCIRTSKSNRVAYNDRFSLVSVNVRAKLQWLQLERSEKQQPIPGPRMRL